MHVWISSQLTTFPLHCHPQRSFICFTHLRIFAEPRHLRIPICLFFGVLLLRGLFDSLFVCLFVCLLVVCLFVVSLFVCLLACLLACLLVCLFVCLFVGSFVYLFACSFVWLLVCLLVCLLRTASLAVASCGGCLQKMPQPSVVWHSRRPGFRPKQRQRLHGAQAVFRWNLELQSASSFKAFDPNSFHRCSSNVMKLKLWVVSGN